MNVTELGLAVLMQCVNDFYRGAASKGKDFNFQGLEGEEI